MKLSLTIDVEEFFHLLELPSGPGLKTDRDYSSVRRIIPKLLDLLEEFDVRAVFFWVGSVAEENKELVRLVCDRGHEIGSHSYAHRCMHEQSDSQFTTDLLRSIDSIQQITGLQVACYRAPGFSLTDEFYYRYRCIAEAGIKYDYSLFAGKASHGGVQLPDSAMSARFFSDGASVYSFPFIGSSLVGLKIPLFGGGYFRLAPQRVLVHAALKPGLQMAYLHPRDFDLDQPNISGLSLFRRFKAYTGISTTWLKLRALLEICEWISPSEYRMRAKNACVDL